MTQQMAFSRPSIPKPPAPIQINQFGGVDYSTDATQIDINRAAVMENMQLDIKGKLQRYAGYGKVYTTAITGTTPITLISYNKIVSKFVIGYGTKLYTQTGSDQPVELYSGTSGAKISTFFMNDKQYFLDGTNYLFWDGTAAVAAVSTVAYVPTLTMGRAPAGGGTAFEDFNLIGAGFTDSFSSDGTADYQLSFTGLDATPVIVKVNGTTKTLTTHYTVNATTGVVTFTPGNIPVAGTDDTQITAYKTTAGLANNIQKCTISTLYGGENDTRVFVTGNPDYPNYDCWCGLYDPTYWPENNFNPIGSDFTAIKGYAKQYRTLLIIKEDSTQESTIYTRTFSLDTNGNSLFAVEQGSVSIGCKSGDTIQIIENSPVFLSSKGVYRISGTNVKDERFIDKISNLIEPNLLDEANLQNAKSFEFEGKYGLSVNGNVYVFDYNNKYTDANGSIQYECYKWTGINASYWCEYNGTLYFGSTNSGLVFKMLTPEVGLYSNNGVAYTSTWKSKMFSMDADDYQKMINEIVYTLTPESARNKATMSYESDHGYVSDVHTGRVVVFNYGDIDFSDFTFNTSSLPKVFVKKIKLKKITFFQLIFTNATAGEAMSIVNILIKYIYQSKNK